MHLPRFKYQSAASLEETVALLKEYPDATLMAGGTELLPRLKYRLYSPGLVISLKAMPVSPPSVTPGEDLALDPLMSLTAISRSGIIRERAPILSEAALGVGSREIRNMGTLGGNLCQETRCLYYNQGHRFQFVEPCYKRGGDICYFIIGGKKCWAVFMADTAPPLISLGARIRIMGETPREIPVEELYTNKAEKPLAMGPGEVLSRILVPKAPHNRGAAFFKLSPRGGLEFATLSVAAVLETEDNGSTCSRARLTVGAVSSAPVRARAAESILTGEDLSEELFAHAADLAASEIQAVPHHGYSRPYLKECVRVWTDRALRSAAGSLKKGNP